MPNIIQKIRAVAGQAIDNLPALKFRDGTDKVTRSQAEGMLSVLQRGEKVTVRAVAAYGARLLTGADFGGWERTSAFAAWERAADDAGGKVLEFIAVSEGVKRDGSTVRVDGIDTGNLAKNPVFLWCHNSDKIRPPIGRIVAIKKADDLTLGRVLLIRVAPLATMDGTEHIDFARMVFAMFENGDMHAVSFGWVPTEYEVMFDAEGYFLGFDFLASDALEVSAVPTPADPDALKKECTFRAAATQYPAAFTTQREAGVFILRDGTELGPLFRAEDSPRVADHVADPVADPVAPERSADARDFAAATDKLRGIFAGPVRTALASNDYAPLLAIARLTAAGGADPDAIYAAIEAERSAACAETEAAERLAERVSTLFAATSEQRAGKVLSRKNRDTVQSAHDACTAAAGALSDLLDSTDESKADDDDAGDERSTDPIRDAALILARTAGIDDESQIDSMARAAKRLAEMVPASRRAPNPYDSLYSSASALAAAAGQ